MVKGSCVCGEFSYEFSGDPVMWAACHCIPCRKTTGADRSLNLMVPSDKVKVLTGKTRTMVRKGDSGKEVTYFQCEKCSNNMWVQADAMDGISIVKVGTIDDDSYVNSLGTPKAEVYCKNMWNWEKPFEGAKAAQEMPS